MKKEPLTLRERQLEYLRILKELDRYCTEKNLSYYIGCGTLIGAVRHKGFIPWDDDLDVFIPRPDYMQLIRSYKSNEFSLHTIYNDKSHPHVFGRLCSGIVFSRFRKQKIYNFGIDLYVINGAPSSEQKQQKLIHDALRFVKKGKKLVRLRNSLARRNLWPSKSLDFPLMNKTLIAADKVFSRYDYEKSDYIWPFGGGRFITKKENYGKPQRIQFEDGMFPAPEKYHLVLSSAYGDYMTPPPEEMRHPYHGGVYYWDEE